MKSIFAVFAVAAMLTMPMANAQERAQESAQPSAAPPAAGDENLPGLGEIMSLQQMRHIKIWFAGHAGNWPLADYEIGELKEGFDDVNKLIGGDTVEKMVGAQISSIEKAIDAKDRTAFIKAYDQLSAGCSACHAMLDHGFIVIQRPTVLPYSDQLFAPRK